MDAYLSQKIRNLSFLLMVLVALIHGYNLNLRFQAEGANEISFFTRWFQTFISDGVCRVAVPLFFAISGFLATYSLKGNFSFQSYLHLLKKRISSLLVPYLLVSASGISLVVFLQLLPWSRPFFNHFDLHHTPLSKWLYIWLVTPVPFQLWFIRFLMFYFLLFPLFFYGAKYFKLVFVGLLIWFWASDTWHSFSGITKDENEGAVFFTIGIFCALHEVPLRIKASKNWMALALFGWVLWVAYRSWLYFQRPFDHYGVHYHLLGITLSGLALSWAAYDTWPRLFHDKKWLNQVAPYSIGVFLFHEPLLTILKKLQLKWLGFSDFSLLFTFISSPIISFLAALGFSVWFSRMLPNLYRLLTGNRNPTAAKLPS